jgi:chromosomal replication initiation ATPase DnaA
MDGQGAVLSTPRPPKIDTIKAVTAKVGNITKTEIESPDRKWKFAGPRQAAMYLSRHLTKCSYPQIGRLFGDRDHTTVLFAYRKVSAALEKHPDDRSEREHRVVEVVREAERNLSALRTEPEPSAPEPVLALAGE